MKKFIFRIAEMYSPFFKKLLFVFVLLFFSESINLAMPYIYGKWVSSATLKELEKVIIFTIISLVLSLISQIIHRWRDKHMNVLEMEIGNHLSIETAQSVLKFSVGQHHNENSGIKQQVINKGLNAIEQATGQMMWQLVPMFLSGILTIIVLLFYNPTIGLVVILGSTIYLMLTLKAHSKFFAEMRSNREKDRETGKIYGEIIRNVELIKLNAQEKKSLGEYSNALEELKKLWTKTINAIIQTWFISGSILTFTRASVSFLGGIMVCYEMIPIGAMISCVAWADSVLKRVQDAGNIQRRLMDWHVDIERYFEMIDTPCDIITIANPVRPNKYLGDITFENVSFTYPKRKCLADDKITDQTDTTTNKHNTAIDNVSFVLEKGKRYAIVGESGSGKSTIRHLMLRSYDAEKGRVLIDGIDIRTLDPKHYLENIGVVDQEVTLFDRTLRENIIWARHDDRPVLSTEQIVEICHLACIDKFFDRLEKGLDTIIGERGVKLSGGEKQRAAIARALAKEPSILICDEATSHLDSMNETDITESLEKASIGRTTIVIAHRLSTILSADSILVMDKGHLAGIGTHQELFQNCEKYKILVWNQIKALEKFYSSKTS